MAPDQIEAGVLYKTHEGHDRWVWDIRAGCVHYFTRGEGEFWRPAHEPDNAPTLEAFAAEVVRLPSLDAGSRSASQTRSIPDHRNPFR